MNIGMINSGIISGCEPYLLVLNILMAGITLAFILFLSILYFTKKNMPNLETKIYKFLIITTLIELITFLAQYILDMNGNNYPNLIVFLCKTRMVDLAYWYALINLYRYVVIKEQDKNLEKKIHHNRKKLNTIFFTIMGVVTLLGYLLPLEMQYSALGSKIVINVYVIYLAIYFTLSDVIYIGLLIYSRGKFTKRKFIPFIIIDIFMIVLFGIGNIFGEVQISVVIRSLVVYAMYHTLENPDVKMVNELTLAKNQAEKSNNAKSDFLSSMSHELRTPLNAIVGLSQLIEEESNQDEVKNDAKDILIASENLLELVNSVLDINMLEANELEKVEVEYNPQEVFTSLINMLNIRLREKQIDFNSNISSNIPNKLYGDKEKIKRIISNLLTNSVKYTDNGNITFNIECTNTKDKCNLKVIVKDTGRGMSEEQLDNLFTKFNRLDSDIDSNIAGAGLGLAITKSLVDLLDGKINVESKINEGTTFTVEITQTIVEETL
ncbi:MAG: ATP-binding protein [Bacilli bacterium]|nr:ATP-binding protein [Bacilli bacterium]